MIEEKGEREGRERDECTLSNDSFLNSIIAVLHDKSSLLLSVEEQNVHMYSTVSGSSDNIS